MYEAWWDNFYETTEMGNSSAQYVEVRRGETGWVLTHRAATTEKRHSTLSWPMPSVSWIRWKSVVSLWIIKRDIMRNLTREWERLPGCVRLERYIPVFPEKSMWISAPCCSRSCVSCLPIQVRLSRPIYHVSKSEFKYILSLWSRGSFCSGCNPILEHLFLLPFYF